MTGAGATAGDLGEVMATDSAPSSPVPRVRAAPRPAAPSVALAHPPARSSGRCRCVPCPARPARPSSSERSVPQIQSRPRCRVRLSRSSVCRLSSYRFCSSAHSLRARVSKLPNPSQRPSSTLSRACTSARRQASMSTRSSSTGSLARHTRPGCMPSRQVAWDS